MSLKHTPVYCVAHYTRRRQSPCGARAARSSCRAAYGAFRYTKLDIKNDERSPRPSSASVDITHSIVSKHIHTHESAKKKFDAQCTYVWVGVCMHSRFVDSKSKQSRVCTRTFEGVYSENKWKIASDFRMIVGVILYSVE